MALSKTTLKTMIDTNVKNAGFEFNDKSSFEILSSAIAKAVVEHIQAQAEVSVPGGSSAGTYKVS